MSETGPSELQIQIALVNQLKLQGRAGVRFWHTPNGGVRSPREAAKLKAMGVMPGVPDLQFVWSENLVPKLLFLELKRKGGRISPTQSEFGSFCAWNNIPWFMSDNVDEAAHILRHHNILPPEGQAWATPINREILA